MQMIDRVDHWCTISVSERSHMKKYSSLGKIRHFLLEVTIVLAIHRNILECKERTEKSIETPYTLQLWIM